MSKICSVSISIIEVFLGGIFMKDYRRAIKEHFEGYPFVKNLLGADFIIYGFGLLFLLLSVFSVIRTTDIFHALGYWLFLAGITLSFIKKNDITLSIGLVVYILINLVGFIIACENSARYKIFFGFSSLFTIIMVSFLLFMAVRDSEYFQNYMKKKKTAPMTHAHIPSHSEMNCPQCGRAVGLGTPFCPHCGGMIPEIKICKKCGSKLPDNISFCVVCGAKIESEEITYANEANMTDLEPKSEKMLCSVCGNEISANKKFCTKCGTKVTEAKRCVECGSILPDGTNVCVICGNDSSHSISEKTPVITDIPKTEITEAEQKTIIQKRICSCCGNEVSENKKFCTKCGTKFIETETIIEMQTPPDQTSASESAQ